MLFNSISFFIFFPVTTILYYLIPHTYRWILLLVASCYFYAYFIPSYLLILFLLIGVDYVAGRLLEQTRGKRRRYYLWISVLINMGILFVFKYFNFFNENLEQLSRFLGLDYTASSLQLILPLGLSFHTFQSLSYVIDVYKGKQKAEKHPGIYALYVMFYPQLVAGPIERAGNMLHQFRERKYFDERGVTEGLKRILIGLFKKVIVADRLALIVNHVYSQPNQFSGLQLSIATVAFAFQIYCDFSGYSDIAIGSAKSLGITLMENFNYPYLAASFQDFWRRWHISLSQWFRDYVYIPLGGNRVSTIKKYRNILIVFAVTGLWHGASWTFVLWGLLHGIYLIISDMIRKISPRDKNLLFMTPVKTVITFACVSFAWIFFRARTTEDALYIVTHLTDNLLTVTRDVITFQFPDVSASIFRANGGIGLNRTQFQTTVGLIIVLLGVEFLTRNKFRLKIPLLINWAMYVLLTLAILNMGTSVIQPFIYFQF